MNVTMDMLLALLGIGQVITGIVSWYFGMQVKLLRLELVRKEDCNKRCCDLDNLVNNLRLEVARIQEHLDLDKR